ncbi:salt tolerance down-regulator-domain-containing protein [Mycena olivaceomarginata]|nr:salt tolerance down-regulator-domain-containing protein [Mycena olivaceomarginata]
MFSSRPSVTRHLNIRSKRYKSSPVDKAPRIPAKHTKQPSPQAKVPAKGDTLQVESEQERIEQEMAPPTALLPSSMSIGKKPMAYQATPNNASPAQGQPPRSARAAVKAPVSATYPPGAAPKANATAGKGKAPANSGDGGHSNTGAGGNDKIWSTRSNEERERIRDFWLALAAEERRDLVRVEKDTVLRKMKEEQKHSCSTAIEDELQVLYDAYYEDLEQYALYQQQYLVSLKSPASAAALPPPPGPGPFPGSVEVDRYGAVVAGNPPPSSALHGGHGGKGAVGVNGGGGDGIGEGKAPTANPPVPAPPVPAPVGRNARGGGGNTNANTRGAVDMKGKIAAGVGGGPTSILNVADDL